jgi:hypothetical protein
VCLVGGACWISTHAEQRRARRPDKVVGSIYDALAGGLARIPERTFKAHFNNFHAIYNRLARVKLRFKQNYVRANACRLTGWQQNSKTTYYRDDFRVLTEMTFGFPAKAHNPALVYPCGLRLGY